MKKYIYNVRYVFLIFLIVFVAFKLLSWTWELAELPPLIYVESLYSNFSNLPKPSWWSIWAPPSNLYFRIITWVFLVISSTLWIFYLFWSLRNWLNECVLEKKYNSFSKPIKKTIVFFWIWFVVSLWLFVIELSARSSEAVENEWIKKCEQSEDYTSLQDIYWEKNTWIKWYRVQEAYLYNRLEAVDEWFFDQPGCLIVMNGVGEWKIIQLELENLEPIFEMDLEEFVEKWISIDPDLLDDFLSRLETSDEIEERTKKSLFKL